MSAGTPLALVLGDPNGVGPELCLRAAVALHRNGGRRSLLIGEDYIVQACADRLGLDSDDRAAFDVHGVGALPQQDWKPGAVSAAAGAATLAYVRSAVSLWQQGAVAAIAAGPHSETAVNASGTPFNGYGGYLARVSGTPSDQVFLMLIGGGLRIVHVTLHEQLVKAIGRLQPELVRSACEAGLAAMERLGTPKPRMGVLGINPHAGENGLFGDEDERIVRPVVDALRQRGRDVEGPLAADLALSTRSKDLYVAMYHDQGHVPVKLLCPKGATALVAGLPFLFASVGHGAAFDIAGRGLADATAMCDAVLLLGATA